jgi:hypothetical protein
MLATLLFLLSAVTEPEIVVRRSAAQPAIERILKADNLDIDRLSAREVSDRMKEIQQGASPDAFWQAYQAHVAAWTDYADALDAVSKLRPGEPRPAGSEWAVGRAKARINRTFETVELIARRYGARVPLPRPRL